MKSMAVFCGSGKGIGSEFMDLAYHTGKILAGKNINIIYGGAKVGLMGALADGAMNHNGKVTGVLPGFMAGKEIAHEGISELIIVKTMHERKLKMHELSDAVIALPGGFGTMEELFEMLTWAQLGLHQKPTGILNYNRYYDTLLSLADNMHSQGFLKPEYRKMLLEAENINALLVKMENYIPAKPELVLTVQNT